MPAESMANSPNEVRGGLEPDQIKQAFLDNLHAGLGRLEKYATKHDLYVALALTVRDRVFERTVKSLEIYGGADARRVGYLSAEFLPGPHLANNLLSLGITEAARAAMEALGYNLDEIVAQEEEPGLGNGGLGRLASCYMDSLASVEVPAIGYGIRYEFGIFDQIIRNGWQTEVTDKWLRSGNPWEIARPDLEYQVKFGGRTESYFKDGKYRTRWLPETQVKGVAYDTPILGYRVNTCDVLRLWKAEAVESFDFEAFNHGDYYRAVQDKMMSENITKVLYPNDDVAVGKELRLKQQYFFCSCSLQDMFHIHKMLGGTPLTFHEKWAVQLNDTHPAVAVAELMRILVDQHWLDWDEAWNVTCAAFAYTNHTLLPEALEKWDIELFGRLLPRHLELIYEINQRFLDELRNKVPHDDDLASRLSLIEEGPPRAVRMAHLATVGSHAVNGVAELHSELLRETVLKDFAEQWPEKFHNVTNGVTPRRFLALSNPKLAELITSRIGDGWLQDLYQLRKLESQADLPDFQQQWNEVKLANKKRLATLITNRTGIRVDPESLFDVQVKRIHEYKRQHLNALHILTLYFRVRQNPHAEIPRRTFIFGGKSAPGYFMAKRIIKLINSIAERVNTDPLVAGRLKVVFFPDFNVTNAQFIYPAANLSEQISTAGKEASGTGNMKFALNGALTIGTLDGANVEIRQEVGPENFFLFGLTTPEVEDLKNNGYRPRDYYERNECLREVIDFIANGDLAPDHRELFRPLTDNLLDHDPFLVLADYQAYIEAQDAVSWLWQDRPAWTRMSILNAARMGKFSSDRSIRDYCEKIWNIRPGGQ